MTRPRVALGLESSRATLNRAACADVAVALIEAREGRKLTIQHVADRLLLSPAQVSALEHSDASAFYGAEFYAAALRKYAAFLAVDSPAIGRVVVGPQVDASGAPLRRPERSPAASGTSIGATRPRNGVRVAVGVVLTSLAGWLFMSSVVTRPSRSPEGRAQAARPQPDVPLVASPPPGPVQVPDEPVSESAAALTPISAVADPLPVAPVHAVATGLSASTDAGRIHVSEPTWIFVRYANNSTVERRLRSGEEFRLRDVPVYVAVGTAQGTEVTVAGQRVDVEPFTANGELRIGAAYLAAFQTTLP